jgi:DNA repair exonuclease SbcCD nuclease subunit
MHAMGRGDHDLGVTILHVSDTQFGRYHRFSPDDSLAGYLIRDVKELDRIGVPPIDLVIVSGDIAEQGKQDEFAQAREFLDQLCGALRLGAEQVVVVPGNHDINWNLSQIEFLQWGDEHGGADPPPPYPGKWKHYREFVTGLHGPAAFTEEQPYRLHRFDDLRVVVAAMNSTIKESHRDEDHYGWCGRDQLRWFADQLEPAKDVLRIGVLHHNARRKAQADNENLTDEDDLTQILGDHLDLLLHGHTHEGKEDRLADGTLVLATGSSAVTADWRPAEVPNQYQVLHIEPGRVTRWAQQWDGKGRWIADTRVSRSGRDTRVEITLTTPGWQRREGRQQPDRARDDRRGSGEWHQEFPAQVALVTRRDLADPGHPEQVTVEIKRKDGLDYVLAFRPGAPMRCVGVVDGTADAHVVGQFDDRVFSPLRSRGSVDLLVVHHGPDDPELRGQARQRGIRLKTWTEYNDLLEPGAYRTWLQGELDADPQYPQGLYQPQRFRDVDRFGRSGEVRADLLGEVYDTFLEEDGQFVLILGDAGFGKSFLVRRLAYQLLGNEQASLTPIVVYLRDRDKRQSLDEMVSAALVPSRAAFQPDRFQHSLEAGALALLIDGYDEFAVRVGYANAAAQLRTFTQALRGRAKVLLTTRPSHFRSTDDVTTKLFDSLTVYQAKIYQLESFDSEQQRAFLIRWFELKGQPAAAGLADSWMRALASVDNLPELARTPRMLSFIVEDLSLDEIEEAARHGTVTAAKLYQTLVSRWLSEETDKIDPAAPGTVSAEKRQELLEELAVCLWRVGERDVTEDTLQQTARDVLDLPGLDLTLDQAAQEFGGRTLLRVDGQRWRFAHQSIYEFLLAGRLAKSLRREQQEELLGEAELTELTIRFLRDLAPDAAAAWAARVSGEAHE